MSSLRDDKFGSEPDNLWGKQVCRQTRLFPLLNDIFPAGAMLRERPVVLCAFARNAAVERIIKKVGGGWSSTFKSGYLPRNKALLGKVLKATLPAGGYTNRAVSIAGVAAPDSPKGIEP